MYNRIHSRITELKSLVDCYLLWQKVRDEPKVLKINHYVALFGSDVEGVSCPCCNFRCAVEDRRERLGEQHTILCSVCPLRHILPNGCDIDDYNPYSRWCDASRGSTEERSAANEIAQAARRRIEAISYGWTAAVRAFAQELVDEEE